MEDTYRPGTPFRAEHPEGPIFTPVATVRGRLLAHVGELDEGRGYWIDHDLPLNGEASDLTAQFSFVRRGESFAVMLENIHVM